MDEPDRGGRRAVLPLTARGRLIDIKGRAVLTARCPLCNREHRYDKGPSGGPEAIEVAERGFSDEWLPCQLDLPGNFWRVIVAGGRRKRPRTPPPAAGAERPGPSGRRRPKGDGRDG